MKMNVLLLLLVIVQFFPVTAQTVQSGKIKGNKITLKKYSFEKDSALATWPILASIKEDVDIKNPNIQESSNQCNIKISPVTEKGIIYIQFENLDRDIKPVLSFCNEKGGVIFQINAKTRLNVINLRNIPPGTYLITADVNKEISTWEIVRE